MTATTAELRADVQYNEVVDAAAFAAAIPNPTRRERADLKFLLEFAVELGAACHLTAAEVQEDIDDFAAVIRAKNWPSAPAISARAADAMTVEQAAAAAGRSENCIRLWCQYHDIGQFDRMARRYVVSRAKLRAYLLARHGVLPAGLR